MLAGCSSSTLVSPRHRLRSEATEQFQACHYPSMSTQRLDLPCGFIRKETTPRPPQLVRPPGAASLTVERPSSCSSLRQNIRRPPTPTTAVQSGRGSLKRYAEGQGSFESNDDDDDVEESNCVKNRAKRIRGCGEEVKFGQFGFNPNPNSSPLLNHPWIMTEITDFSEKNLETTQGPAKEASAGSGSSSSTSSESRGFLFRQHENIVNPVEIGNGSESAAAAAGATHNDHNNNSNNGVELISLLVACVEAVGSKNFNVIHHCIARLGELASPRGRSPISRLTAYFTEALALRVSCQWPQIFHIAPPRELDRGLDDDCNGNAVRFLNEISPIPRFIHFTSNEIILRVFEGKDRVHIIDFDIKQGLQWPSLFQSLASRSNPPSHVRITGIGDSKQQLLETGERLSVLAEQMNLEFEFHPVVDRLEDVRLWMLHVKEGETVAVNCMLQLHKLLYDGSGRAMLDFLGLIRSTNPTALVIAEQETEHDEQSLESRLANSLKYYAAVFDSLDYSDSPTRIKVEEMFGREIRNIIGFEGRERLERHSRFERWRRAMEQGNFRSLGITERELMQSRMLLKMHDIESFRVEKQGDDFGGLTLCWEDQRLYTVSAWAPIDLAGSSSSYSQPS